MDNNKTKKNFNYVFLTGYLCALSQICIKIFKDYSALVI